MALVEDLQSVKKIWGDTGLGFRVILVISTFLASSSVASLADAVFHWKGFILTGIEYYRSLIVAPLVSLSHYIGFDYYPYGINSLIAISILIAGIVWVFRKEDNLAGGIIFAIFAYGIMLALLEGEAGTVKSLNYIGAASYWFIYFLYPFISKTLSFEKEGVKLAYFTPGIIAVSITLILAAINSGLTRPLT